MSRPACAFGVLLAVAVAACGGDAGVTTTTPPTTIRTPTTTATTLPAKVAIPDTGIVKFRAETTYVASAFWEPVSFTTDEDGLWWSRGATDLWVHVEYHEGGESEWDLDVSIVAKRPSSSIGEVVEEILLRLIGEDSAGTVGDTGRVLSEPSATTVGGFDAMVLDVAAPDATNEIATTFGLSGHSRFAELLTGVVLLTAKNPSSLGATSDRQWSFGVREERIARIWIVDVHGSTITIIAAARDQELFDELIPAAEKLLSGIEFDP